MNKVEIQKTMATYTRVYKNSEVNVYNNEQLEKAMQQVEKRIGELFIKH